MATEQQKQLGEFLAPLTELACNMIMAGVLKKNVIKHFTNRGLSFDAAENIMQVGCAKAENRMERKAN